MLAVSATKVFSRNANRYTCKANPPANYTAGLQHVSLRAGKKLNAQACLLFVDIAEIHLWDS